MADFKHIEEARKLLGLDEEATLQEVKDAYRKLALKYHPDKCKDKKKKRENEEMSKKINHARDILMAFCACYKYSFRERDVKRATIDKAYYEHLKRFYGDWFGKLDL